MRLLQICLSGLCLGLVAWAIVPPDAGFWMAAAVSMALVLGVSLSVDFSVWAHEARKHKEP